MRAFAIVLLLVAKAAALSFRAQTLVSWYKKGDEVCVSVRDEKDSGRLWVKAEIYKVYEVDGENRADLKLAEMQKDGDHRRKYHNARSKKLHGIDSDACKKFLWKKKDIGCIYSPGAGKEIKLVEIFTVHDNGRVDFKMGMKWMNKHKHRKLYQNKNPQHLHKYDSEECKEGLERQKRVEEPKESVRKEPAAESVPKPKLGRHNAGIDPRAIDNVKAEQEARARKKLQDRKHRMERNQAQYVKKIMNPVQRHMVRDG